MPRKDAKKGSLLDQIAEKEAMIAKLQSKQKKVDKTRGEDEIWEEEEDGEYQMPPPEVYPLPTHVYVLGVVVLFAVVQAIRIEMVNNNMILGTGVAVDEASDPLNPRGKVPIR
jgi:hypothetical protein